MSTKLTPKRKIHLRIRKNIKGTASKPRLTVNRSNKAISCQLIDDIAGQTLASVTSSKLPTQGTKTEAAKSVGLEIAAKAKDIKIESVVFDRSGYLFHGRIKALAEGAREGGLQF